MMSRMLDLEPLCHSGIGFDRLLDMLELAMKGGTSTKYPPYNIERCGEDGYRLTLAVAGWTADEIAVATAPNLLVVSGEKAEPTDRHYLYRGISTDAFEQRFVVADHVRVRDARMADGLLTINFVREVPETFKAGRIGIISNGGSQRGVKRQQAAWARTPP